MIVKTRAKSWWCETLSLLLITSCYKCICVITIFLLAIYVATPLWGKCEDETHTPKSENLESSGTLTTLELDRRGKNTSPWSVLYTVGKALKCRCRKWPRMSRLWTSATQVMGKRRAESQTSNLTLDHKKSGIDPIPECDTLLENSWRKLQVCFRPHPNPRSEPGVMSSQSPGSPNRDSFETPPWESRE